MPRILYVSQTRIEGPSVVVAYYYMCVVGDLAPDGVSADSPF